MTKNPQAGTTLEWRNTQEDIDWDELTALYHAAPLGKAIVARLVELSRHHKKIILYAVPGKEAFYRKLGFKRMNTAMALFVDPAQAQKRGLINDD